MEESLKIYSYAKCGTCKKALAWLNQNDIEYELIDIINSPPSKEEINIAINKLGSVKYLLNTSGKSYRQIGASAIKAMKKEEIIKLLNSDSKIIKRPFVINSYSEVLIGFNELKWESFFLS